MDVFAWIGIALTAAVLALTLRPHQPVFALLTTIAAGLCLLWIGAHALGQLSGGMRALADASGIQSAVYIPVMKAVGIAAAVRVAGAICKDAGQGALAVKLELVGSIAALGACMPLFEQLLSLVRDMLG